MKRDSYGHFILSWMFCLTRAVIGNLFKNYFLPGTLLNITMDMTIREALADGIRSEASVEQYVKGIAFIWKICFPEEEMPIESTWLKTRASKVVECVLDRYDNPGSRRTRLSPFLAVCRKLGYSDAYKLYYEPFGKPANRGS